ncbi:unnamed protein product, partial [uncultured virus]
VIFGDPDRGDPDRGEAILDDPTRGDADRPRLEDFGVVFADEI